MLRAKLRHVPALDGLRGVAVAGVLAFHLGHLPGGYLGVDLFFVLSGFLITSLLLTEWRDTGDIDLRTFWARRARRLMPAMLLVVGAVALYAATSPDGLSPAALRGDALATLGYGANWHSIYADRGYWELFAAPSLLAHTWSLAIEEQVYVVWPLVVFGVLRFGRGRLRTLVGVTGALALASMATMVVLHGAGDDTARTYFGTDTRAAAVLVGALVAVWHVHGRVVRRRALEVAGVVAAVALAVAWVRVEGTTSWLYEGGFAVCSLGAALVIASIAKQTGPLARALSVAPLRHLGQISYGVYLWHWPVFVVTTPERTGLSGWPLLVAKLALTMAISELSYRLVERPIRTGSLRGWRIRLAAPAAAGAAVVGVLVATVAPAPASSPAPAPPPPVASTPPPPVGTTRVLVVGDSGAWFMGEGMTAIGEARGVEVRNAGTVGCGIANEGGRLKLDDGGYFVDADWCHQWPARWLAELDTFRPDVALLVLAWPGIGDRMIGGAWRHPCDATYDAYYRGEVRRALGVLGSTGARVVLTDSPYLWLPVTQADHAARVDCLNDIYRSEAAQAGAQLVSLGEWLCADARHCISELGGVELRYDGIHFRDGGAELAASFVVDELSTHAGEQQHAEPGERNR